MKGPHAKSRRRILKMISKFLFISVNLTNRLSAFRYYCDLKSGLLNLKKNVFIESYQYFQLGFLRQITTKIYFQSNKKLNNQCRQKVPMASRL